MAESVTRYVPCHQNLACHGITEADHWSPLNILKRKRRALQLVIVLASLSAVFHLTKGVDYEEASLSLLLIALLVTGRHHFTVRSRPSISSRPFNGSGSR